MNYRLYRLHVVENRQSANLDPVGSILPANVLHTTWVYTLGNGNSLVQRVSEWIPGSGTLHFQGAIVRYHS